MIKVFNTYADKLQDEIDKWLKKNQTINPESIALSSYKGNFGRAEHDMVIATVIYNKNKSKS